MVKRIEKHKIRKRNNLYAVCEQLTSQTKNLYNSALYEFRKSYVEKETKALSWQEIDQAFLKEKQEDYIALPREVATATIKQLGKTISKFWRLKNSKEDNDIKLPKYLHKTDGRFVAIFNSKSFSKQRGENGELILCLKTDNILIPTMVEEPVEVRIVPKSWHYVIEVEYDDGEQEIKKEDGVAAIDLGVSNIATVVFNGKYRPLIISGSHIVSIDNYFIKKIAHAKTLLPKGVNKSKRLSRLLTKRNNKISFEFHNITRYLADYFNERGIKKVIIGKNNGCKTELYLDEEVDETKIKIPYKLFIQQLTYKCKEFGIYVILQDESFTSKSSFLDGDKLPTHKSNKKNTFSGERVHRGLYETANGKKINADINGAYNIMLKNDPKNIKVSREELLFNPIKIKRNQIA